MLHHFAFCQQCRKVPVSPHPHQHFLFSFFTILIRAIFVVAKWYLAEVVICINLMTNDVERIFICLLADFISSVEKCIFKSFARLLIWLSSLLSCKCSLYSVTIRPLSERCFANIFSFSLGCLFLFFCLFTFFDKISLIHRSY